MKNIKNNEADSNGLIKLLIGGFFWVLSALSGLAITGLIIYILIRVASHPW